MAWYSVLEWGWVVFVSFVLERCQPSDANPETGIEVVAGWVPPEYSVISTEDHVAAGEGSASVPDLDGGYKSGVLESPEGFFKVCDIHRPTGNTYALVTSMYQVANGE